MFFQRIEDLRVDEDLSQQEIADMLHMQREVYRRYEKGTYDIPVWVAIQLADFYHVSLDYLLGRTDENRWRR